MRRPFRAILAVAACLAVVWLGGFIWFVRDVTRPAPPADKADGIVVLTGGADRIATGLRLLEDGCCTRLLISGVGPHSSLAALLRDAVPAAAQAGDAITLGRAATSTAGNADETAAWAHGNHLHSLMVVTAFYHMPRALFELSRTAPDLVLIPVPVSPPVARHGGGLTLLSVLAHEYTKFLGSALGLTRFEHGIEPAPETAGPVAARHDRA